MFLFAIPAFTKLLKSLISLLVHYNCVLPHGVGFSVVGRDPVLADFDKVEPVGKI